MSGRRNYGATQQTISSATDTGYVNPTNYPPSSEQTVTTASTNYYPEPTNFPTGSQNVTTSTIYGGSNPNNIWYQRRDDRRHRCCPSLLEVLLGPISGPRR